MAKRKWTDEDRERRRRADEHARQLRELAEKAYAKLDDAGKAYVDRMRGRPMES